jgi:hypothetical protein
MRERLSVGGVLRSRGFAVGATIVLTVVVVGALVYLYFFQPVFALGPAQPIPFSHRVHVTVKEIDCRFCHYSAGRTRRAGLPSVNLCLYCHKHVIPEHAVIRRLRGHKEDHKPVAWRKVTWLPDHVYFSHQRHIRQEVECASCHGTVEQMDRVHESYELQMGFCLDCHWEKEAPVDCWTCHH